MQLKSHGWKMLAACYLRPAKPLIIWFKHPDLKSQLDSSVLRTYLETHLDNVEIVKINLDQRSVPFDVKYHKWVHMKTDEKSVEITPGFERDKAISYYPDSVLISGPKSVVTDITDTLKIKIPYKDIHKDFNESFKLSYFLRNSSLKISHEKVKIMFKVRKKPASHGKK